MAGQTGLGSTSVIRQPCRPKTAAAAVPANPAPTITMSQESPVEAPTGEGRLFLRKLAPELRDGLAPTILTGLAENPV